MANYQANKVPIFPGINDIPTAPTASSGGNISHFYDLYNTLIDLLEADITVIETAATTDYASDIAALQSSITNLQTDINNNANNITTNGTLISNNTTSIDTINLSLSSLQTSIDNNTNNIVSFGTRITDNESNINTLTVSLSGATEVFTDNTIIYLDTIGGNDSNNGLTSTTAILTVGKLKEILESKLLPNNIEIKISGTITEPLDFSRLTYLLTNTSSNSIPTLKISSGQVLNLDVINFKIEHNGQIIRTNNNYPLNIILTQCDFKAIGSPLYVSNSNSSFDFQPPCNFDTTAANTESILYFDNTEIEISTFGTDLIFNNSEAATLECAVKLNKAKGIFEKCTINNISTFVIAENFSYVQNILNDNITTNVTVQYDLRLNSQMRTDRYSFFNTDQIIFDGSSNVNNSFPLSVSLTNPLIGTALKILNNAPKKYFLRTTGYTGFGTIDGIEYTTTSGTMIDTNYRLLPGDDLFITLQSSATIDYIAITIYLFEEMD